MKVFCIVALLLAVASVDAGDKWERVTKKWTKMKAMEGCFGKDNMEKWIVKMKKAKKVCTGQSNPLIHTALFKNHVSVAMGLINKHKQGGLSGHQQQFVDDLMRKNFVDKLMHKFMGDSDDDLPYFQNKYALKRFRRDTEDEDDMEMDMTPENLADELVKKMVDTKEHMETEMGNWVCILKEMGMIKDSDKEGHDFELDLESMNKCLDESDWTGREYLHKRLTDAHNMCYEYATGLPKSILEACSVGPAFTQLKHFKLCMKEFKIDSCMSQDIVEKLEGHGINVDDFPGDREDNINMIKLTMFGDMAH